MRDSAWMMSIGIDRLLHSFRTNAGVYAGKEGGYMTVKKLSGWESLDCELRGHTTGHILSALGLMYASTGDSIFKEKGDSLVSGLAEVQKALGNGYLSAFPEELINRNIRGKSVWAPWYTLHKILSGLIDQYLYAGNSQALDIAAGMGNWAYAKLSHLDEDTRRLMIRNEFGGINESFLNLYAITGDSSYAWLAGFFYHNDVMDPMKAGRDELGTKHTNTFIPKVIAEARKYELTGDPASRDLCRFFWNTMISAHLCQSLHPIGRELERKRVGNPTGNRLPGQQNDIPNHLRRFSSQCDSPSPLPFLERHPDSEGERQKNSCQTSRRLIYSSHPQMERR